MKEYIKKVLEYLVLGYSEKEVMAVMKDVIAKDFGGDEELFYRIVHNTFERTRLNMPKEEYEKIKLKRKARNEEAKAANAKKLADKIVSKTKEYEFSSRTIKDALLTAMKSVAAIEGISLDILKTYMKKVYPDFYDYYINNRNIDEKYYIDFAQKIIDNNMYESIASYMPQYYKMMKYITVHRPDLLAKIQEVYKSHRVNNDVLIDKSNSVSDHGFSASDHKFLEANLRMLFNIITEFRVPISTLCVFINQNLDIFCKTNNMLTEDGLVEQLRKLTFEEYYSGIKWYLQETSRNDQYTEMRIARFNEFASKFSMLKNNSGELKKLIIIETGINLKSVFEKTDNHIEGELYNFTSDEIRTIARFIYRQALTEDDVSQILKISSFRKSHFINMLSKSSLIEDQMLTDGLKNLNEYFLTHYYAPRNYRKN